MKQKFYSIIEFYRFSKTVLHIGDSLDADYYAASSVGINACLIVRKDNSNITDDIKAINKLTDILEMLGIK